jgi:8-oxo-dGTP diphosphatase
MPSIFSTTLSRFPRSGFSLSVPRVQLPYRIATLLYVFNERDEVLLLERTHEPNRGFWSPCGGKVHTDDGESPYACACREAHEELGLKITAGDLHLTAIVSEHNYGGAGHWLIFLFEVKLRLRECPPKHREGTFCFFERDQLPSLHIPQTDRDIIWPLFWEHRGGFFAAHWKWFPDGHTEWTTEESRPAKA